MAAVDAVLRRLAPGDHILVDADGYGGTYRLLTQVHQAAFTSVDLGDLDAVAAAWTDRTRLVWVESPTNPGLGVVDIAALSALARERGAWCAVDNTFATPWLQRPLELGAHVVVHSTSKYLSGHSDVIGGFVATDDDDLAAADHPVRNAAGSVPGPFDCFLVLRGVKTLALRMDRHCENALAVAGFLHDAPGRGPGPLPGPGRRPGSRPGRPPDARGFRRDGLVRAGRRRGGGGGLRVAVPGCSPWASRWAGWSRSIGYPARMSHAALAGTPLAADPGLVRLSVGIEDVDDLLADLERSLSA